MNGGINIGRYKLNELGIDDVDGYIMYQYEVEDAFFNQGVILIVDKMSIDKNSLILVVDNGCCHCQSKYSSGRIIGNVLAYKRLDSLYII